jgi:hypothetical protein
MIGIYQRFSAFVSLLIVLTGEGSVTFLRHQHISWLSRNKFVAPDHQTWNVDMSLYTLSAARLRYLNQMICLIGTWLNATNAINFSKNLRKMLLVQFKFTVLLLLFPAV